MISQETKDMIEKEAIKIYPTKFRYLIDNEHYDENELEREACIAGMTAWAEKKSVEIGEFKEAIQNLHDGYDICKSDYQKVIAKYKAQLESKDRELIELKSWHDYYKERAEKGEGILKSATDIHFIPGKEGDNLLASKDHELAQLKEITKGMVKCIQAIEKNGFVGNGSEVAMNEALTAYTEWCKQNLK